LATVTGGVRPSVTSLGEELGASTIPCGRWHPVDSQKLSNKFTTIGGTQTSRRDTLPSRSIIY
jgi:hypothetical protein